MHGKPMPESLTKGQQIAQLQGQKLVCFGPQTKFKRFGKCGAEICELFEQIGSVADDICLIRSMTTEAINHDPAHMFMNTGSQIAGRPSMGSWVALRPGERGRGPAGVRRAHVARQGRPEPADRRAAMVVGLPAEPLSRACTSAARAIRCSTSSNPPGVIARAAAGRRRQRSTPSTPRPTPWSDDPEIATRIAQYEMAFKMQASVPELMDTRRRADRRSSTSTAASRATARSPRTACWPAGWPSAACGSSSSTTRIGTTTAASKKGIKLKAQEVDRACMALITDLKQRGMLEDTLVVWAGEFGRTPMSQGGDGRDHHNKGFSIWLAGGGIKRGLSYGRDRRTRLRGRGECRHRPRPARDHAAPARASTTSDLASNSRASTRASPASKGRKSCGRSWRDEECEHTPDGRRPADPRTRRSVTAVRAGGEIAVRDLTWTIHEGETWAIVGSVASGKTALAETLLGRHHVRSGEIHWPLIDRLLGRRPSRRLAR